MKDKIRPLYSRLQGYLNQAPILKAPYDSMSAHPLCDLINSTLDELSTITNMDHSTHKFSTEIEDGNTDPFIRVTIFRGKLGGIIAELHGTYFADEVAPFNGMPSMIITQNASQSQQVQIAMLLEIQSKIDQAFQRAEGENEKGFLEEIKTKLSGIKSVVDLLALILSAGESWGLTVDRIKALFGL